MIYISYFNDLYNELRFPIAENKIGLRNAQIGAIHAIASYATLNSKDAAVIVMPTGSGKTTVIMMAPYLLRKKKVLIVTPSAMVRNQIVNDYTNLRTLKYIGVLPKETKTPIIYEAKHLYSTNDDENILRADVVIATHQVASSISEVQIKNNFDYIIFDEAHHVPAPTWQRIIKNMIDIPSLLVTATPFRLDKKEIKGKTIYNYPLSRAYKDGIFGEIMFNPIDESSEKDKQIALEAEKILLNDREGGYEHFLMVRTNTKNKAKKLEKLYEDITKLKLKRIDSTMSIKTIENTIKLLKEKKLDGIICVDMLGEGFDFPNLKIAAIHEPHKSLASTLQFIGRFARTNAEKIGTAKFIAMNDDNLKIENHKLYSSDAAWQDIIINMSEEKIERNLKANEVLSHFIKPENQDDLISLNNIRPNCHAKVYKVSNFNIYGSFPKELKVGENIYRSEETNSILGISKISSTPLWLDGDSVLNNKFWLYIVHYQPSTKLLFIYSQNKTEAVYESIVGSFAEHYVKISRDEMNRVLAEFSDYEFFNTGMQNRYSESGESYRIYAGSNTAASIDETTGKMLSAGHAFCKVKELKKDGSESTSTIGYSSGSKFWSSSYLDIPEYIKWCDLFGKKISNNKLKVKTNTNYDKLPMSVRISEYKSNILFCFLDKKTFVSPCTIVHRENLDKKAFITDITLKFIKVNNNKIEFEVQLFDLTEILTCDIMGKYNSKKEEFICKNGKEEYSLAEYFSNNPLLFKTADDTVYCGQEVLKGNLELEKYDKNRICTFKWDDMNVNINLECGIGIDGMISIQDGLRNYLEQELKFSHIIFDHGTGEIADFITFEENGNYIYVEMYHCKAMKGKIYNSSVNDVYEVTQQAIKSSIWISSKAILLKKINDRVLSSKNNKFVRGDFKTLKKILQSSKLLRVKVYVVQPAISKSVEIPDKVGIILSAATTFIKNTGKIQELLIIGSE
ncbi:DEAD/DEAH box helicase [Fusobacterium canifelinum]|uniref:DEAD/DEAH box helicase n=1 Tax=Fusobacterium canifelinum TaxID=285729 RepID=A0A3P1UMK5_9FUSO|nr:DEAD/DEAH box helicase family protein [Fusobacterium canifelinum]RRD21823.1 DEAD/DEAH box helicase [Fusobacterium canifelinum]